MGPELSHRRAKRALRGVAVGLLLLVAACGSGSSKTQDSGSLTLVRDLELPGNTSRFDYQALDPESGRLYIAHLGANELVVFDVRSGSVIRTITGVPGVHGVIAVPQLGRVYASATSSSSVAVIDTKTLEIVATVAAAGKYPDGLAYDPDVNKVYVSDETGGTEAVIDAQTNRLLKTIPLGGEVGNTQYDWVTHHVLVAVQGKNQVVVIDPENDGIIARINTPGCDEPHGLALDPIQQEAYVACQGNARLIVLDLTQERIIESHKVGDTPDVLALDMDERVLYVAAENGPLAVFRQQNKKLMELGLTSVGPNAHSIAVDPVTHYVFLPLQNVNGKPVLREMMLRAS